MLLIAPGVLADEPAKAKLAEALFQSAKKLMAQGKYSEACPKLAESNKLDPGGGTLLLLAQCHESEGKLASAWSEYREALAIAIKDNRADRVARCKERLAIVEPKLSHVTVTVSTAADVPGLTIVLDGVDLPRAVWGTEVPIDPGTHTIRASAEGYVAFEKTITVGAGPVRETVAIDPLVRGQTAVAPAKPPPPRTETVDVGRGRRTIGWTLTAVGVVAMGVGGYFGYRAIDKRKQSDENCPNDRCTALGVELNDQARTSANISNVAIGAGLVTAVVGVILVVGAPKPEVRTVQLHPIVSPTLAGLSFATSF